MTPDAINACFEGVGALFAIPDVWRLLRDRTIRGVYWPGRAFWITWGVWNLYFYPAVDQPLSFFGGCALTAANAAWLTLAIRYRSK